MSKVINFKNKANRTEPKFDYMAIFKSVYPELHEILTHYNYKLVFVDGNAFVETDTDLIPLDLFCVDLDWFLKYEDVDLLSTKVCCPECAECDRKTRKLKRIEAEFDSTRSYFNCCNFIRFDVKSIVFKQYEKDINKLKAEINSLYTQLDKQEVF